jgi:hypothetical protein
MILIYIFPKDGGVNVEIIVSSFLSSHTYSKKAAPIILNLAIKPAKSMLIAPRMLKCPFSWLYSEGWPRGISAYQH